MKLKLLALTTFCLLQTIVANSQSSQPFKSIGKVSQVATLTNGQFDEFFDEDSIQLVGTALININTHKIVKMQLSEEEIRELDNAKASRFLSVDPITSHYPELTPYQFASNIPIAAIDLDGLEAKLAIACKGYPLYDANAPPHTTTGYTPGDIGAFDARANKLKSIGYSKVSVHNGVNILETFKSYTNSQGSILGIITYAHSGANGIYLDNNAGFYTQGFGATTNASNIDAIAQGVNAGEIKFEPNAVWVFASCNAGNPDDPARPSIDHNNIAEYACKTLGITTIGAYGYVEPEEKNGKETGKLVANNYHGSNIPKDKLTFIKYERIEVATTKDFTVFGIKLWSTTEKTYQVKATNLGSTIDPKQYLPH